LSVQRILLSSAVLLGQAPQSNNGSLVVSAVAAIISLIAVVVAAYNGWAQRRHAAAFDIMKSVLDDRVKQLNEFYFPLQAGLERLKNLKRVVLLTLGKSNTLRGDSRSDEPRLLDLVSDIAANASATKIVDSMVETQRLIQQQILVKSGYIRNPALSELVGQLNMHFDGFQLAYQEKENDEAQKFDRFPRALDETLRKEIETITLWIERHRERADKYVEEHWINDSWSVERTSASSCNC